jgi:hypothetical protein
MTRPRELKDKFSAIAKACEGEILKIQSGQLDLLIELQDIVNKINEVYAEIVTMTAAVSETKDAPGYNTTEILSKVKGFFQKLTSFLSPASSEAAGQKSEDKPQDGAGWWPSWMPSPWQKDTASEKSTSKTVAVQDSVHPQLENARKLSWEELDVGLSKGFKVHAESLYNGAKVLCYVAIAGIALQM